MSLAGEARREEDEERMKRRRSRGEDDKGRREVQEEEPGKARRRRKNPTGDMLFGCFCSEVLFVDLYRGPARLIAQHFINREQKKKKTGRCVWRGATLTALFFIQPHASSYTTTLPIPVTELWLRWLFFLFFSVVVFVSQPHLHARADAS